MDEWLRSLKVGSKVFMYDTSHGASNVYLAEVVSLHKTEIVIRLCRVSRKVKYRFSRKTGIGIGGIYQRTCQRIAPVQSAHLAEIDQYWHKQETLSAIWHTRFESMPIDRLEAILQFIRG